MERFQGKLVRDGKTLLDGVTGNFTGPGAGFFAAPPTTTLAKGAALRLQLDDGREVPVTIEKVVPNAHRPAIVHFTASA